MVNPILPEVFIYLERSQPLEELHLAEVTARGLTTVPTPKRPSGPMARSGFFKILCNPYYIGIVRYKGAEQPGNHEPLIDIDTWEQVQ